MLVLHKALWMGNTLYHTLVNPNQLLHYRTRVQDNSMSESPLSIITEDGEFSMEISMEGSMVFSNTHTRSYKQKQECPPTNISSPHPWDPMNFLSEMLSIIGGGSKRGAIYKYCGCIPPIPR